MKLSLVTAVMNRRDTIGAAMESVQGQSHRNLEHLVQDGGSTDGTLEEIAARADARTMLESAPDGGIYDALNRGIARATGEVVGVMHSDDLFADGDVLRDVAAAFADPQIDGVYGDLVYVSETDPARVVRYWRAGEFHPEKLAQGWMPPHPTLYLRRSVFDRLGTYDTSYRIAADYDAMLRWLGHGGMRLAYLPRVLVKMRSGGASNGSLARIVQKSREDLRALRANRVGGMGTLMRKNAGKLGQFWQREKP